MDAKCPGGSLPAPVFESKAKAGGRDRRLKHQLGAAK